MSNVVLQIRVKKELKAEVSAILQEIGVDIPTAVRMFFKAVVREKQIPFPVVTDQEMERRKAALVGMGFIVPDRKTGLEIQQKMVADGFTVHMNNPFRKEFRLLIADYLPPTTTDSDGFLIENDALAARIRRELRQEPYNRQDDSIFPLLIDEQQRGSNEDVIGFIPGKAEMPGYQMGYMYLPSKILWYSNLEFCIPKVIPGFDIYGCDYPVTWQQWQEIKAIADQHGVLSSGVAAELDHWLRNASDESCDPAMTIMCI